MTFTKVVADKLLEATASPQFPTIAGLEAALRLLAKWRSRLIDKAIVARHGVGIQSGPFKGMIYAAEASEASVSPKLLGIYEASLHPVVEEVIAADFDCIIDVGCSDGYYAVGFARRMSEVEVFAFDIDPVAQRSCLALAQGNNVSQRVNVAGRFAGEYFLKCARRRSLVFMDIEGGEEELLRPDLYSSLGDMTVIVECHDVYKPGLSDKIAKRFSATHSVRKIEQQLYIPELPAWLTNLNQLDHLLAVWEWRMGPTPWLYLQPLENRPSSSR